MRKLRSFKQQEVAALFKTARRVVRHAIFDLLIAPKAFAHGRLLVITPKRVGNAPERNKIRRQLKAIFQQANLEQQTVDCIVIIKKIDHSLPFTTLQEIFLAGVHKGIALYAPKDTPTPNHQ